MNIHYFQHVPFEGLGSLEDWIKAKGHAVSSTAFYENQTPPPIDTIDWLIIMGGPMSIDEEQQYPWLAQEKQAIAQAIEMKKKVLGICLGAQLIAAVLGASVKPNAQKEIGFFPVQTIEDTWAQQHLSFLPQEFMALHWHGDTFTIPEGANHWAQSQACQNQAFTYNNHVWALQFHLETTPTSLQALVENCSDEIVDTPFIQSAEKLLSPQNPYTQCNQLMHQLMDTMEATPV